MESLQKYVIDHPAKQLPECSNEEFVRAQFTKANSEVPRRVNTGRKKSLLSS